jgi:hypothetical protein
MAGEQKRYTLATITVPHDARYLLFADGLAEEGLACS